MRFDVFRCLLLVCCVAVLVGMSQPTNQTTNSNDECNPVNETSSEETLESIRNLSYLSVSPEDQNRQNKNYLNQNFTLTNATCSNASLSCARRSCPDQFISTTDKYTCYCDSYCELFQDCCYDYWNACNRTEGEKNVTKIKEDLFLSWSCVRLGGPSYWMKNNCSKSWLDDEIANLCIDPPSRLNSSTYMDFLPVLGADNITYRNRHCAQCNYQNTFEFWMFNVSLSFEPVGIRSIGDFIDFIVEFEGNKILSAVVPKKKMPRRYCRKPISNCDVNLASEEIKDHCILGGVALVFGGATLYKNKHCAFCNGNNKLTCALFHRIFPKRLLSDFYLTINFKHKAQLSGYSINHACRSKIYDYHLKACVLSKDIVAPIDAPLDKYNVAVWLLWPYSTWNMPDISHFRSFLTDVKESNIQFNGKFQHVQKGLKMMRFEVRLTLNQSIELLENPSKVEPDSADAYSIFKFIKPFTRQFILRLGSKKVKVIKTSSRQLGCVGMQVYNMSDYTKIGPYGKIYVHKTKLNYTRHQYFKDDSSNGLIRICEKQLPNDCGGFYLKYERSEFEVQDNLSLYHNVKEVLYKFGEYTLRNNSVYICHKTLGDDGDVIRQYLTMIGLCLSIFCLIIVFVTYITFSELRTAPGKNIINLTIGLVLLDVIWLVSPQAVQVRPVCIATAFGTQYFILAAHISMAKIAHDTLCMFTDPIAHQRKGSTRQIKTFVVFWLIPLVIVALCFVLWHLNILDIQYTENCWLAGKHVFAIVYLPICVAMAFNILCFTRSILKMRKLKQTGQMLRAQNQEKSSVFIYIKISTILGLGWASAFIAVLFPVFSYVFVILTTFQGVYIFLAFVCKRNVLTLYRNLICGKREDPVRSTPVPLRSETALMGCLPTRNPYTTSNSAGDH